MRSMMETGITIDANCIKGAWDTDKPFRENAVELFRLAVTGERNTGMYLHDRESHFLLGIGAISLNLEDGSEDNEWLLWQIDQLKKLNAFLMAAQSGIHVSGIDVDKEKEERLKRDYDLRELFQEGARLAKKGAADG